MRTVIALAFLVLCSTIHADPIDRGPGAFEFVNGKRLGAPEDGYLLHRIERGDEAPEAAVETLRLFGIHDKLTVTVRLTADPPGSIEFAGQPHAVRVDYAPPRRGTTLDVALSSRTLGVARLQVEIHEGLLTTTFAVEVASLTLASRAGVAELTLDREGAETTALAGRAPRLRIDDHFVAIGAPIRRLSATARGDIAAENYAAVAYAYRFDVGLRVVPEGDLTRRLAGQLAEGTLRFDVEAEEQTGSLIAEARRRGRDRAAVQFTYSHALKGLPAAKRGHAYERERTAILQPSAPIASGLFAFAKSALRTSGDILVRVHVKPQFLNTRGISADARVAHDVGIGFEQTFSYDITCALEAETLGATGRATARGSVRGVVVRVIFRPAYTLDEE